MTTIMIAPIDAAESALWELTREIASLLVGLPWTLIGGQMVRAIEAEHGGPAMRVTADVDALVDVRALAGATWQTATRLQSSGFGPVPGGEGVVYRFVRGGDVVDVLAPDHLGARTDITTVPPAKTLEAIGGRQALNRSREVTIDTGTEAFVVPLPSLVGAIVMKARVVANATTTREKHRRDLARLLVLVADPARMREELSARERAHLRERAELLGLDDPAWWGLQGAQDGALALRIVSAA